MFDIPSHWEMDTFFHPSQLSTPFSLRLRSQDHRLEAIRWHTCFAKAPRAWCPITIHSSLNPETAYAKNYEVKLIHNYTTNKFFFETSDYEMHRNVGGTDWGPHTYERIRVCSGDNP